MNISFIIPLYNEETTIRLCLESIVEQMCTGDEIIVVDNGSTDNSVNHVISFPDITILDKPKVTIAAVRNSGAMIAKSDILAFIDADCVLSRHWRDEVVRFLRDERISATGSRVDIPADAVWIERVWYSQRDNTCSRVSYINSGNFVVRKSVFDKVGGFSEALITGEDSELGWRINKAGHSIVNNPAIRSIHLGNPKNLKHFYRKERWRALGMMGTFRISWFDKPLIMTIAFAVCNVAGICISLYLAATGSVSHAIPAFLCLTLCVPSITASYRVLRFKNTRYFFHLICLYWIYFLARANVLCTGAFKQAGTQ